MENLFYFRKSPYINQFQNTFNYFTPQNLGQPLRKIGLTEMIKNAENGLGTINRLIPIYKQIQPMYTRIKSTVSSINGFLNKNKSIFSIFSNSKLKENVKTTSNVFDFKINQTTPNPPKF